MRLSAPKVIVFLISLILVVLGVLAFLGIYSAIPYPSFWIVVAGYAVLALGVLMRGL